MSNANGFDADKVARTVCQIVMISSDECPTPMAWGVYRNHLKNRIVDEVKAALLSAHRVPDGCVRLPDGREVKVFSKAYNKQGESYSIDLRVESTAEEWNAHQQRCRAEWLITNPNGGQLDRKVRQG